MKLRAAICQFAVSDDIVANSKYIRQFMKKASRAEADVVHFPETALSGYGRTDFASLNTDKWREVEDETRNIAELSGKFGILTVFGSCRKVPNSDKPANCVYIVSRKGEIAGIYDKRRLTPAESEWYSPGKDLLTITINDIKCGFLICYELRFPEMFAEYRSHGVRMIFHSSHNVSRKPQPLLEDLTMAQLRTRAADHQLTIASANSSARHSFSRTAITGPEGSIRTLRKHMNGLLLYELVVEQRV